VFNTRVFLRKSTICPISSVARINLLVKEEKDVPETLQNEYEQVATLVNSDNDLLMFISAQKGYLALVQSLIERIIPDQL
jgi:hypothetical protein